MVGIDIVEVERIDERKIERLLTANEKLYLYKSDNPARRREVLAGLFAGKEAVFKALGCGHLGLNVLQDIEILHEESGRPYACFHGERLKMELSISHTQSIAVAVAMNLQKLG